MKTHVVIFGFLAVVFGSSIFATAQSDRVSRANFALGVVFRLETLRQTADDEIAAADRAVERAERTISDSLTLAAAARAKGNESAAATAESAATTARAARDGAAKNKESLLRLRGQIDAAIRAAKENLGRQLAADEKPAASLFSKVLGSVFILRNGRESAFTDDPILKVGDTIRTAPDGRAQLTILDGRGTLDVSGSSKLQLETAADGTETIDLSTGAIRVTAEPESSFLKSLESVIERYKRDTETIRDEYKRRIVESVYKPYAKKLNCRTPTVVLADRGTSFIVRIAEDQTEIVVSDGSVEIEHRITGKRIVVGAGFRVYALASGFSEITKIN